MVYNYISTYFYATCLVLYAWYRVNLETFTFLSTLPCLYPSRMGGQGLVAILEKGED
jgi:hypothetical protein